MCLKLGIYDVERLKNDMDAGQFMKWIAYAEKEPFGNPWENWLMAVPAYHNLCVHSDPKKPPPKFETLMYEDADKRALRVHQSNVRFFDKLDKKLKRQDGA